MNEDFDPADVIVITVCLGASTDEVERVLREEEISLLTLVDEELETATTYHALSTPTTYLIDADGVIVTSEVGYGGGTQDRLREQILALLEDPDE